MEIGPIDMLMSLVFAREVDPWNIDIVELTEKYLEQIQRAEELDLRLSGKTYLVATILLRMQSESFFIEEKEDEEEEEEELDFEPSPILPPLRRRSGKITLPELLNALLTVLEEREKRKDKPKKLPERHVVRVDIYRVDIKKYVDELFLRIKMIASGEIITFSQLLIDKSPLFIARTFLYLLFLEMNQRVEIWQEAEFGEIYIKVIT
ncbi:MAG: segregation/condensation protein A [Theionarchaea archaeon]|nr:segregation/condensation protein A [Theionarchaea archaeon]MBU6999547.1 segregation/condensation protein A [Theionarchaea archaeon]MBU7020289.1 segregation/condensation protein A [Theionarchaea archaeon]MBU7035166.1 segregation/condensation protein A [Theionarchaea archaeon]MBU7041398.1 segregation/condensation protein A [Theionarchaea archaeon]